MDEQARLAELKRYKIMDTSSEQELDELVEIASAICGTPISLVTFIDDTRQWFKAQKGVGDVKVVPRELSFCHHLLDYPGKVLVVDDPLNDERFKDNPMVQGNPHIRFYAGAPLETPNGNVLGTLCVIDNKTHKINDDQKRALVLMAKKVMDYLETRNILLEQSDKIEFDAARLKKLTDQVPGAIYQFEMKPDGAVSFPFISKGISDLHPGIYPDELKDRAEMIFDSIYDEDRIMVRESIGKSFSTLSNWNIEYRIVANERINWLCANAHPEKKQDGTVVWYGTIENITEKKEYIKALEGILFDISHVMRKPVTTIIGLANAIQIEDLDTLKLNKCIFHIKAVSQEMDDYTKILTSKYFEIRDKFSREAIL